MMRLYDGIVLIIIIIIIYLYQTIGSIKDNTQEHNIVTVNSCTVGF